MYGIKVGYAGDIVYLSDNTHIFDNKNIDFDKNYIDAKIKKHSDETKVDWDSVEVRIEDGKLAVKYAISEQHAIAILPLE